MLEKTVEYMTIIFLIKVKIKFQIATGPVHPNTDTNLKLSNNFSSPKRLEPISLQYPTDRKWLPVHAVPRLIPV